MTAELAVVTGAGGHVGTNLVQALLAEGQAVRTVDICEPVTAVRLGAAWIPADVRDAARMRDACEGAGVVYHLAAVISVVGGMGGLVESVNVDGVRAVAQAALAAGVRRMVLCSSAHAFDLAACIDTLVDESSPRSTNARLPVYDRSKARGEVELRRVADRGLDTVVVNPTGIVGPCDEKPSRMGTVMLRLWRGRLPAVVAGGFDWVDVRDVVTALRAAAQQGRTGENYLIGGHRRSMRELAELAGAAAGAPLRCRTAPAWSLRIASPLATAIARRTHNPLLPTREALAALAAFPTVSHAKATRELGHRPRPIEETIADLHAYFRRTGRLPAQPPPAQHGT